MLKTLCIGGVTISTLIGARKLVRHICEPRKCICDPLVSLPIIDLQRSATLSHLAYETPAGMKTRMVTDTKDLICIDDICREAAASETQTMPIFFDGRPHQHAQAFLWKAGKTLYIAFRGTESAQDALSDIDVRRVCMNDAAKGAKVHRGFYTQFKSIDTKIIQFMDSIDDEYDNIVCCGHSLGGALATLAAADFASKKLDKKVKCHTVGSPRVGNAQFCEWFDSLGIQNWRIYNENDPVPMIPISHRFVHVSNAVCINDDGVFSTVAKDTFWIFRPLLSLAYIDIFRPICDHDCKLYISRLKLDSHCVEIV